jgi:hypothetical protein
MFCRAFEARQPVNASRIEAASARSSLHFFKALAGKPTTP